MSCRYANLDQEALLHLEGPDALTFLQGQVTCDTRELKQDRALPGAYCSVKGRVVCDFLLSELAADHLVLRLRREIRATSAAVFGKYIVFSKARLEAEREDWHIMACWGPTTAALLQELFGTVPRGRFGTSRGEGFILVQLDESGHQFECYLQPASTADTIIALQARALAASEAQWQALQIAAGIARIQSATSAEYTPQMLNYDVTGHISFKKGCYTGQEVVARLHYRGQPKRRLYRAEIALSELSQGQLPEPGAALYKADATQAIGNIINCVPAGDGRLVMLVTAASDSLDADLHLLTPAGPSPQISPMPYPVPG